MNIEKIEERFDNITKLVKAAGRPIKIFDLETTGLLSDKPVGIVEYAALVIDGESNVSFYGTTINPGRAIPPGATAVHGITDDMVKDSPLFTEISEFCKTGFTDCLISGFNQRSYDVPVLIHNFDRYALPAVRPDRQLDLRDIWCLLHKTKKGKLGEVAEFYGIEPGPAHRAFGDILTAARVLEKILQIKSLEFIQEAFPTAFGLPEKKKISYYKDGEREIKLEQIIFEKSKETVLTPAVIDELSEIIGKSKFEISRAIGDMLQTGLLTEAQCVDSSAMVHILPYMDKAIEIAFKAGWDGKKLKPLKQSLDYLNGADNDYIQLRIAIKIHEHTKKIELQQNQLVEV